MINAFVFLGTMFIGGYCAYVFVCLVEGKGLNLFRRWLGYEKIIIFDFDKEGHKRWAKKTPYGLVTYRFQYSKDTIIFCHPDGSVTTGSGALYVKKWAYPNAPEAASKMDKLKAEALKKQMEILEKTMVGK